MIRAKGTRGPALKRFAAGLVVFAVVLGPRALGDAGEEIFSDKCASCHGPDGKAHTPAGRKLHAKDLTASKLTDDEIRKQVNVGHKDERGQVMPAFKDDLKPDQIEAVVVYVKSLRK
jgi:mono/diheme cytochrome c family protein